MEPERGGLEADEISERLQTAVDKNRSDLEEAAASPAAESWLKPSLRTPEGTFQVYSALERLVAAPGFLAKLTAALTSRSSVGSQVRPGCEVLQSAWWEPPAEVKGAETPEEPGYEQVDIAEAHPSAEPLESYVLVEHEDVLEAIGSFIAAYLAELPEAQRMQPEELQIAVKNALKDLKKSRMRQFWGWGRAIYRCLAFSYGAFSVYENPWLVRAVLAGLWTASRMMLGLLV